jgi:dGTPase
MDKMSWCNLLSAERFHEDASSSIPRLGRSNFDVDVDRITFSGAFRRLNRKTQVHPLVANDHIHTRLTHSLEVASVGQALGKELGIWLREEMSEDLSPENVGTVVRAACLAHDLGNPPFGHGGETAMNDWFAENDCSTHNLDHKEKKDICFFNGNAQGFRLLTAVENYRFQGGLRLTHATLGTFLKYPWTIEKETHKFSVFVSEESILDELAEKIGLLKVNGHWCRHPLAYLVEAADDICYGIIDLEDAVELGILPYERVEEVVLEYFQDSALRKFRNTKRDPEEHRLNLPRLRGAAFDIMCSGAIQSFKNHYGEIIAGKYQGDLISGLGREAQADKMLRSIKDLTSKVVFQDSKKIELELGSYSTYDTLLKAFCIAGIDYHNYRKEGTPLRWKSQRILSLMGEHAPSRGEPVDGNWTKHQCLRRVLDYVSGMTDNYATYIASQLKGTGISGTQRP